MKRKEVWKFVVQTLISVLTALGAAFGLTSCRWFAICWRQTAAAVGGNKIWCLPSLWWQGGGRFFGSYP